MKKLFISVPMNGRTEEAIKASIEKMHRIAEAAVGEELERIPSYIETMPPETAMDAVWYLGKSIQMLAEADYMVVIDHSYDYRGCFIEEEVARKYGIPIIFAQGEFVAPDAWEEMTGRTSAVCKETEGVAEHD